MENLTDGPSVSTTLDALADRQRRRLLLALSEANPQRVSGDGGTSAGQTEDSVRLHHVHLPKLVEDGFVEWDEETDEIRKGPHFDRLEPFLDLFDGQAEPLSERS
jgi:hypothetical protein